MECAVSAYVCIHVYIMYIYILYIYISSNSFTPKQVYSIYYTFRTAAFALNQKKGRWKTQILRPQVGQYLLRHRAHRCPSRSGGCSCQSNGRVGRVDPMGPRFTHNLPHEWLVVLKIFLFSPRESGKIDPFWRAYFSNELKPPTYLINGCFIFNGKCFSHSANGLTIKLLGGL